MGEGTSQESGVKKEEEKGVEGESFLFAGAQLSCQNEGRKR